MILSDQIKSLLRDLIKITAKERIVVGYEKLSVTGANAQSLQSIPATATYMEIRIESATTTGIIARYKMLADTNPPTTTDGIGLTYLDLFDVNGMPNIVNFRIISVAGTHTIHVQYYK